MIDPQWSRYSPDATHAHADEQNGHLEITTDGITPATAQGPFAGFMSTGPLRPFADCSVVVEVLSSQTMFAAIAVRFELIDDSDPSAVKVLRISQVGPNMVFHNYADGNVNMDMASVTTPYIAADQRWWRFNESQGTTSLQTSKDGKEWITQKDFPTPSFAQTVRINLTMGAKSPSEPGGTVVFDNMNLPPP